MNEDNNYVKATSDIFIKYMFGMDTKQMQPGQEYHVWMRVLIFAVIT